MSWDAKRGTASVRQINAIRRLSGHLGIASHLQDELRKEGITDYSQLSMRQASRVMRDLIQAAEPTERKENGDG